MYCDHCGSVIEPGMRYCPGCGAPRGKGPRLPWGNRDDDAGEDRRRDDDRRGETVINNIVYVNGGADRQGERAEGQPYRASESGKSYVVWAFVCLVLYIFYVPGLVANIFFWRQALRFQRETGVKANGTGCLVWLLMLVGVGVPVLFILSAMLEAGNPSR